MEIREGTIFIKGKKIDGNADVDPTDRIKQSWVGAPNVVCGYIARTCERSIYYTVCRRGNAIAKKGTFITETEEERIRAVRTRV